MSVPTMSRIKRRIQVVTPEGVREELDRFERDYAFSSEEFLRRWHAGVLDDRQDFFQWYGACHLAMTMGMLPTPEAEWHALG